MLIQPTYFAIQQSMLWIQDCHVNIHMLCSQHSTLVHLVRILIKQSRSPCNLFKRVMLILPCYQEGICCTEGRNVGKQDGEMVKGGGGGNRREYGCKVSQRHSLSLTPISSCFFINLQTNISSFFTWRGISLW